MKYTINDKVINIPDKEIKKNMDILNLTEEEAVEMWLEDEGYLENEEQEELCQKAKDNRITATIHKAKTNDVKPKATKKEKVVKEDEVKAELIAKLMEMLEDCATDIETITKNKLIRFKFGDEVFEFNLIRKNKNKL